MRLGQKLRYLLGPSSFLGYPPAWPRHVHLCGSCGQKQRHLFPRSELVSYQAPYKQVSLHASDGDPQNAELMPCTEHGLWQRPDREPMA